MYLSRLILEPRSRAVSRDINDVAGLHRTLMLAFPTTNGSNARATLGVLFRLEPSTSASGSTILVQSSVKPAWERLPARYLASPAEGENPVCREVSQVYARLAEEDVLRFRLRANPARKIDTKTGPDGQRRNGRRQGLHTEAEQVAWLTRKGEHLGFQVLPTPGGGLQVRIVDEPNAVGWRGRQNPQKVTVSPVLFEGLLRVTDAGQFLQALAAGIGPGKAYGCGLLSIVPPGRES